MTCTQFHPWARLVGFASIENAEIGLIIHDVAGRQKGEAQVPAKPQVRDGQYARMMNFGSSVVRGVFCASVIRAVLEHSPSAFEGGAS